MEEKKKDLFDKIQGIIVLSLIGIFIILGSLSGILFPGSDFDRIISSSIGKFFDLIGLVKNNYVNILESVAILLFVGILNYVLLKVVKLFTRKGKRGETLGVLFASIIKYLTIALALLLILSAWGVQTPTLLAGAGIVGLAISFGAQGILEDVFAGLSIIFEKQFVVGDIVQLQGFRGIVLEIGPKNTRIKDIEGNVLIIANSDIREIINLSAELSIAVCEVAVEYEADLNTVEKLLIEHLPEIKNKVPEILDGPFFENVESLADSGVVLRVTAQCRERHRLDVRRKLNKEIKILCDQHGINIPFPQVVIHQSKKSE